MRGAPSTTRTSLRAAPRLVRRRASTLMSRTMSLRSSGTKKSTKRSRGTWSYQISSSPMEAAWRIAGGRPRPWPPRPRLQRRPAGRPRGRAPRGWPPGGARPTRRVRAGSRRSRAGRGQVPLGRRPEAEVQDVGVTAQLDLEPGVLGGGQVGGHDRRRPAVVGPRRRRHASVADGDQLRDPVVAWAKTTSSASWVRRDASHSPRARRGPGPVPRGRRLAARPCRSRGWSWMASRSPSCSVAETAR